MSMVYLPKIFLDFTPQGFVKMEQNPGSLTPLFSRKKILRSSDFFSNKNSLHPHGRLNTLSRPCHFIPRKKSYPVDGSGPGTP